MTETPGLLGVNLRVTGHCQQGGRKYMEDVFSVAYQPNADEDDIEYTVAGIFDGHGGPHAAIYAKNHLIDEIVNQDGFWSADDKDVLAAIRQGYIQTHYKMWREQANWPRTASGLLSTSGTTASIAFIRHKKIYVGHVGDSCIVLGYQKPGEEEWRAMALTKDHKPESKQEHARIQAAGGKVASKSGVARVVWNRPRSGHKGPVRRSTTIDEIPFLAVARALGDFWSFNQANQTFVVSPEPDVDVFHLDTKTCRVLILGSDGLWNMLTPAAAVSLVQETEKYNENNITARENDVIHYNKDWVNPSRILVERAIKNWSSFKQRADNTSAVTILMDPESPVKLLAPQEIKEEETYCNHKYSHRGKPIDVIQRAAQTLSPIRSAYKFHQQYEVMVDGSIIEDEENVSDITDIIEASEETSGNEAKSPLRRGRSAGLYTPSSSTSGVFQSTSEVSPSTSGVFPSASGVAPAASESLPSTSGVLPMKTRAQRNGEDTRRSGPITRLGSGVTNGIEPVVKTKRRRVSSSRNTADEHETSSADTIASSQRSSVKKSRSDRSSSEIRDTRSSMALAMSAQQRELRSRNVLSCPPKKVARPSAPHSAPPKMAIPKRDENTAVRCSARFTALLSQK